MNEMIGTTADEKDFELFGNLLQLRQALDVYCLIAANADAIEKRGEGNRFFLFLRAACVHLIALDICKVFEDEKKQYALNSIDGVLMSLADATPAVLDCATVSGFVHTYGNVGGGNGTLLALSQTVDAFKRKYEKELKSFKEFRDKCCAHSEYGYERRDLPSYDVMERLFDFGAEFYKVVSRAFVSVGPCDLNQNRYVKIGLTKLLSEHGLKDVKTEME